MLPHMAVETSRLNCHLADGVQPCLAQTSSAFSDPEPWMGHGLARRLAHGISGAGGINGPHVFLSLPNDDDAVHLHCGQDLPHHVHSCLVGCVLVTLYRRQHLPSQCAATWSSKNPSSLLQQGLP